ncbi:hypothetical protein A7D16_19860 [Xanthomonas nasturtii]|uniref:Uncharacterized protein n=1 Tax=Xanthomonas nasturtii TaxID=1843581 RepID=A0A3E1KG03_9XANT|nr:hypothetical protein A7D16_19860 [Xanthomonas nasturtii]RFF37532.1 hypothetical protein DZD52_16185 [Xanthomonas nasturtii]
MNAPRDRHGAAGGAAACSAGSRAFALLSGSASASAVITNLRSRALRVALVGDARLAVAGRQER